VLIPSSGSKCKRGKKIARSKRQAEQRGIPRDSMYFINTDRYDWIVSRRGETPQLMEKSVEYWYRIKCIYETPYFFI
jgi:hypothetical protein